MSEEKRLVRLTIDGKVAQVPADSNVLEAAKSVGVRVPNFCYHPDLIWEGSCRMCLVSIKGRPKLTASCCEPVGEGMEVEFSSQLAEDARRAQLEFLLINHPLDCPICDQAGECKLQDYYVEHGRYASRMPRNLKFHKEKVVDLGERIVLDKERCVLCSRCVRFCRDVSGSHALQFFTRGVTTEIGTENDRPITGDDYIGNVVDICPVGALTSKDFRFRQRVWFLKSAESVCAHCSTGCNIRVDSKDGQIYRFVPRRNPEVNRSWICDAGRDSYKLSQGDARLSRPRLRRGGESAGVPWEEALSFVSDAIRASRGRIAALATPRASNETLFVFKRFAQEVLHSSLLDYRVDGSHTKTGEMADRILRRSDPNPNNSGCRLLGLDQAASVDAILETCAAGKVKLLYLLGPELLHRHPDPKKVREALAQVEQVVVHATHEGPGLDSATVLLPDAPHTELAGTFVNYEGRVQRFQPAFAPRPGAVPAHRVLAEVARRLAVEVPAGAPSALFDAMAASEPAFQGMTFERIDRFGTRVGVLQTAES